MPAPVKAGLPGPKGGYFSGSVTHFRRDQLGFYDACAREYGDVVDTRMGPYRILLIYHPDAIEEIFVTRNRDFVKSPGVRLLRPLLAKRLLPKRLPLQRPHWKTRSPLPEAMFRSPWTPSRAQEPS